MSDPDADHAREALAKLDMLVVQDIFLTETGYLADVILPASSFAEKTGTFTNTDRFVQLGRQALNPPGKARQDLEIIIDIARHRLGLSWSYGSGEAGGGGGVRRNAPHHAEHRRHYLGAAAEGGQRHLSLREGGDPGDSVVFIDHFPTPTGKGEIRSRRHHSRR